MRSRECLCHAINVTRVTHALLACVSARPHFASGSARGERRLLALIQTTQVAGRNAE